MENPKVLPACRIELQDRETRKSMHVIPLGFCLWVIVNKKPLHLEKTTSSVLSVLLLIYEYKID